MKKITWFLFLILMIATCGFSINETRVIGKEVIAIDKFVSYGTAEFDSMEVDSIIADSCVFSGDVSVNGTISATTLSYTVNPSTTTDLIVSGDLTVSGSGNFASYVSGNQLQINGNSIITGISTLNILNVGTVNSTTITGTTGTLTNITATNITPTNINSSGATTLNTVVITSANIGTANMNIVNASGAITGASYTGGAISGTTINASSIVSSSALQVNGDSTFTGAGSFGGVMSSVGTMNYSVTTTNATVTTGNINIPITIKGVTYYLKANTSQ